MNDDDTPGQHKRDAEQYLRDAQDRYGFTRSGRLYEPSSAKKRNKVKGDTGPHIHRGPRWTQVADTFVGAVALLISLATLVGLFFTARYAYLQWGEAKRTADASICAAQAAQSAANTASSQFGLMKQQMEYTQQARVIITASFWGQMKDARLIDIDMRNSGNEHATGVKATFTITERSLRNKRLIRAYPSYSLSSPRPLDPISVPAVIGRDNHSIAGRWAIEIPYENMLRVWSTEEFLEMQVRLHYVNGFKIVDESQCLDYVAHWLPDWVSSPRTDFIPCADLHTDLPGIVKAANESETYEREQQKKVQEQIRKK